MDIKSTSFLFLGANSPWTYGLAEALAQHHHTHAVEFYDQRTFSLIKPSWPGREPPNLLTRSMKVLPPGYAGCCELLFRAYLQNQLREWIQSLRNLSGSLPWVIACHPNLATWVRKIPSERLIYYNFDDYLLYRPKRVEQAIKRERELVEQASFVLCASLTQKQSLQKKYSLKAADVHHYPHGVVQSYINRKPDDTIASRTVGYVGSLGDRLDWKMILDVAKACPDIKFVFVGGRDKQKNSQDELWVMTREKVLSLFNVQHVGKVVPEEVAKYYWSFAISWIPYLVDHKFNQAACPTKIMDGIASGRPIISTDIPECRLYPEWIEISKSVNSIINAIREKLVSAVPDNERSRRQIAFAQQNTWLSRSEALYKLLHKLYE